MIEKDISQITEADLQALIDDSVPESKTIEYKQALPGNSDSEKKEFLADVSSFANASGGDIAYGITEDRDTGKPELLQGLTIENVDQEILRLENLIRSGIEPRLPSVTIRQIPLSNARVALIIRALKSWSSPHCVSFADHYKFYSRGNTGKYRLDVNELRAAFGLSETAIERLRKFRIDRISRILAGETPIPFYDNAKIVLHLIPLISFNPAQSYSLGDITSHPDRLPPIYCSSWSSRHNLDGFLTYGKDQTGKSYSYVQLFRNGIIEAVEGLLLEPHNGELSIPSIAYEEELSKSLSVYLSILRTLCVTLPVLIFLGLLQVKGYSMAVGSRFPTADRICIDRDILLLPEIVLDSYEVRAEKVLRPSFDSVWNACGFSRSFNYNDNGEWASRR